MSSSSSAIAVAAVNPLAAIRSDGRWDDIEIKEGSEDGTDGENDVDDDDDDGDADSLNDMEPLVGAAPRHALEVDGDGAMATGGNLPPVGNLPHRQIIRWGGVIDSMLSLAGKDDSLPGRVVKTITVRFGRGTALMIILVLPIVVAASFVWGSIFHATTSPPTCDIALFNTTFQGLLATIRTNRTSAAMTITTTMDIEGRQVDGDNAGGRCDPGLLRTYKRTCACTDPFLGVPRTNANDGGNLGGQWSRAYGKQNAMVANAVRRSVNGDDSVVDVTFFGDSITEHFLGLELGSPVQSLYNHSKDFERLFSKSHGAQLEGLDLAISGDESKHNVYRIEDGLLSVDNFHTKLFWVLIGTNDMGHSLCSVDSVVAGNIAVVEALRRQKPGAKIVLTSLLPRKRHFMSSIRQINERLECYADRTDGIEFFNATAIFMDPNGTLKHLPDQLHPDAEGNRILLEQIAAKVTALVSE